MADYFTHFSFVVPFDREKAPAAVSAIKAATDDPEVEVGEPLDHEILGDGDFAGMPSVMIDDNGVWIEDDCSNALDTAANIAQWLLNQDGAKARSVFFQWAATCSAPRLDAYGGGAILVKKDAMASCSTHQMEGELDSQIRNGETYG